MSADAPASKAPVLLVVDDDATNRDLMEQEIEGLGLGALTAASGPGALDVIGRVAVDLVLLDVMMPGMDGIEVLGRLKADAATRSLPVIMVSALDDLAAIARAIELGADDYLPKPFDPVLLHARIRACLERKRWRDLEVAYLQRIEQEKARSERLLGAILPVAALEELTREGRVTPRRFDEVTVLFADIVGFTAYSAARDPVTIVDHLGQLMAACEAVASAHGMEKIKSIGDGLVATSSLTAPAADPVMDAVRCGFAMIEAARATDAGWGLRVGIAVGPVVGGVVGQTKFTYDLWGNAMNFASRLSAYGAEPAVLMTAEAWAAVAGRARGTPLGTLSLKGTEISVVRCDGVG